MDIKSFIRTIEDFPRPGIGFKDITPLLADGEAFRWVVGRVSERYRGKVDAVVGIESRGFILGAAVAYDLGVGLSMVRKPGKLPHQTHSVSYELEYGRDSLEVHVDALEPGSKVVVVDDLLATGGTARATVDLVQKLGAEVVECAFVIELGFLGGRAILDPVRTHALISYDD